MSYSRRELYAMGEPLGESATRLKPGGRIYGGGGGGGPTTSTTQTSNIPDWLRPQVESVLGGSMQELFNTTKDAEGNYQITGVKADNYKPFSTDPSKYVAGFTPLQQSVQRDAANMQMPGQFNQATGYTNQATQGALGSAQDAMGYGAMGQQSGMQGQQSGLTGQNLGIMGGANYGGQGAGYGQQAAQLAGNALGYGQNAATIGQMGLGAQRMGSNIAGQAQNYGQQAANAGNQYAQQATNPYAVQAYMSPYMQNVVDVQNREAMRNSQIAGLQQQADATRAGAFGGGRDAIMRAERERNLSTLMNQNQAQGLQNAFQQAQQAQQFGSNLGLQGLQGAQQGLGTALQGGQLGLSGIGTALQGQQGALSGLGQAGSMYGLGMQGAQTGLQGVNAQLAGTAQGMQGAGMGIQGAQAGLQGVQGAQSGYGLANQAATNLANIGSQQLGAQQNILGMQNQIGAQEQARNQQIINQDIQNFANQQQAPMQAYNQYNALLRGYAMPGMTTTQYQAAPSLTSQVAGLGTAAAGAYGLMKKAGGMIKEKQGRGIDTLGLRNALNAGK